MNQEPSGMSDTEISVAWRVAAVELYIRVFAPYSVTLPDGNSLEVKAYLPDFGSQHGAFAVGPTDESLRRLLKGANLWVSMLGPAYRIFKRDVFEDTLEDWGWFGTDEHPPQWYTGKYYGGRKTSLR